MSKPATQRLTKSFWAITVAFVLSSAVSVWFHLARVPSAHGKPLWLIAIHVCAIYCAVQLISRLVVPNLPRNRLALVFRVVSLLMAVLFVAGAIWTAYLAWAESRQPGGVPPATMFVSGFLGAAAYAGIAMVFGLFGLCGFFPDRWAKTLAPLLFKLALLGGALVATVATAALAWLGWVNHKEAKAMPANFSVDAFWLVIIGIGAGVSFLAWRLFLAREETRPSDARKRNIS